MRSKLLFLSLYVLLAAPFLSHAQLVARNLTASNGQYIGFYEFKPKDYNPSIKYPLIVFLHGQGERGNGTTELPLVLNQGIPRLLRSGATMRFTVNGVTRTFLVLAPQLDKKYGNWQNYYSDEMLKYALLTMSVDTNSIYITGLSLGGGGTWHYSTQSSFNASRFAAVSPICGTGESVDLCNLTQNNTAVWAFHAMDDNVVAVGNTQYAEIKLNQCDPNHTVPRQFTYYPTGGHGIWDRAYDTGHGIQNPNLYEWFLMHSKVPDGGANVKPIANAGTPITISVPATTAKLTGSASYDPDGTIAGYSWRQLPGSANVANILTPNNVNTTVSGLKPGLYSFELTVTDNFNAKALDVTTVLVKTDSAHNIAPTAKAGNDTIVLSPSDSALLNGLASYDVDGLIVSSRWAKVSGPAGEMIADTTAIKTKVTGLKVGTYQFALTVTDEFGAWSKDTMMVTVTLNNKAPVANAGNDFSTSSDFAYLSAGASYDPDGKIVLFEWTQVQGPNKATIVSGNTMFPTVKDLIVGIYKFKLRVVDNLGGTALDTVTLQMIGNNQLPVANAGPDATVILPTTTVTLDGSTSMDPDGTIVAYSWQKLSGPASGTIVSPTKSVTQVTGLAVGIYVFELKVTDNKGGSATDQVTITVAAAANKPPIANAGNDFSTSNNYAYLSAGASWDPDGKITIFDWTQKSGPNTATLLSANTMFPTAKNLIAGTYTFHLKVTDNQGATAEDDVVCTVLPNQPPVVLLPDDITVELPLVSSVQLDGSASFDPDGSIVAFEWKRISGPIPVLTGANQAIATLSSLVENTYVFQLTVTDNRGAQTSKIIAIHATNNRRPVANAGSNFVSANNYVYLSGGASYDPDGTIVAFKWTQQFGPSTATIMFDNTMFPIVKDLVPGIYAFNLEVTDDKGAKDLDFVIVTVIPGDVSVSNNSLTNRLADDVSDATTFTLAPNPASSFIKLNYTSSFTGKVRAVVYDANGKVVFAADYNKGSSLLQEQVDIAGFMKGVYYLELIEEGKGQTHVKKFIKL